MTPLAPGGLGRRRRQPPPASAGQQLRGAARLHAKRTDGLAPRAPTRAQTGLPRAHRRAHPAHTDAQPARPATCTRRVYRRVFSASRGAQPARLCGVRSVGIPNRSVLILVLLLWYFSGWATFVFNQRDVQTTCLRSLGGYGGPLSPGQTILLVSSPARPRLAAPPCAPTRPARGRSGFWIRQIILLEGLGVVAYGGLCFFQLSLRNSAYFYLVNSSLAFLLAV